jgi:hypothetical protein
MTRTATETIGSAALSWSGSVSAVAPTPLQPDGGGVAGGRGALSAVHPAESPYMTTEEAAAYLRKSVSWLLRVPDMPFLRGKPNLYAKGDLDGWVEKHKFRPRLRT